jgi:hypothetical protein
MAERDERPGRTSSPYSRTGLFPWGSTYEVPVRRDGRQATSHTPCHLRPVGIPVDAEDSPTQVRCPACGRAWTVQLAWGVRPQATWTA